MTVAPVVRYMIVCDETTTGGTFGLRASAVGIATNVPLNRPEGMCVLLLLTEVHKGGYGLVHCTHEETGEGAFVIGPFPIPFQTNPARVMGVPLRAGPFAFPAPGRYSVRFYFGTELLEERPLLVR